MGGREFSLDDEREKNGNKENGNVQEENGKQWETEKNDAEEDVLTAGEDVTLESIPPPRALLNFIIVMFNNFKEGIRNITRRQLIIMVAVFVVIFAVNLYLVVFVNDGFVIFRERWYTPIMAVEGTKLTVSIFWIMVVILCQALFFRIKSFGLLRFFKDLVGAPSWFYQCVSAAGDSWALPLLLWCSVALLLSLFISNPFIILVLALMAFFSFNAQLKGGVFYVFYLANIDWIFTFKKKAQYLNVAFIFIGLSGVFAGLLISYFLPFKPYSAIIMGIAFLVLMFLLKYKRISVGTAGVLVGFMLLNIILFRTAGVLAHDGGFQEGGGNIPDWLASDGAGTAATQGTEAGLLGSLASLLGSLLQSGGLSYLQGRTGLPVSGGVVDLVRVGGEVATAGNPTDANWAAARSLDRLPITGGPLSGLRESMMSFDGAFGGDSGTGSGADNSSGGNGGGGGRRSSSSSRRRGRRKPWEPPPKEPPGRR